MAGVCFDGSNGDPVTSRHRWCVVGARRTAPATPSSRSRKSGLVVVEDTFNLDVLASSSTSPPPVARTCTLHVRRQLQMPPSPPKLTLRRLSGIGRLAGPFSQETPLHIAARVTE